MLDKLKKLIDVKSIVTLVLTCVFSYLAIAGKIETQQVMIIYTTIIAFYFGTQSNKNKE